MFNVNPQEVSNQDDKIEGIKIHCQRNWLDLN